MTPHEFTADEVDELLGELDVRLRGRGEAASISVVGGAAVAANRSRRERITADVDALTHDTTVLEVTLRSQEAAAMLQRRSSAG